MMGTRSSERRPALGVIIDWLGPSFTSAILRGALSECRRRGADAVIFQTGRMDSPREIERCSNALFNFIPRLPLDAFLFSGANQTAYVTRERIEAYLSRFSPRPLVLTGLPSENRPSVVCDDRASMRAIMEHLIGAHGKKKIAFFRGPLGIVDAEERFLGYRDALETAGLAYDPDLVVQGTFVYASSLEPARSLALMAKEGRIDAVAACNDGQAAALLDALGELGLEAPGDLAVTGYDDSEAALERGLTSYAQPFQALGSKGAGMALDMAEGRPAAIRLQPEPGRLALRGSCGCDEKAISIPASEAGRLKLSLPVFKLEQANDFAMNVISRIDRADLGKEMESELSLMGFRGLGIGLYAEPEGDLESVTVFHGPGEGLRSTLDFLSEAIAPGGPRADRVVMSLYEGRHQLGIMAMEADEVVGVQLGVLRTAVSASLEAAALYQTLRRQAESLETQVEERTRLLVEANAHLRKEVSEREEAERKLREALDLLGERAERFRSEATMDELTGVLNRRGFFSIAEKRVEISQDLGRPYLLYYFDLDGLKLINDNHGHDAGDRAIKAAAEVLQRSFRADDTIGRLGGDEFAVLASFDPGASASPFLERFQEQIEEYNRDSGEPFALSFSHGMAVADMLTDGGLAAESSLRGLLAAADARLYERKRNKKAL